MSIALPPCSQRSSVRFGPIAPSADAPWHAAHVVAKVSRPAATVLASCASVVRIVSSTSASAVRAAISAAKISDVVGPTAYSW